MCFASVGKIICRALFLYKNILQKNFLIFCFYKCAKYATIIQK